MLEHPFRILVDDFRDALLHAHPLRHDVAEGLVPDEHRLHGGDRQEREAEEYAEDDGAAQLIQLAEDAGTPRSR